MTKLSMKNNKEAIYLAYFEATEELEQLKKAIKPKPSLCDITKTINNNLKDEVLSNHIKTFVALVVSYLVLLYVSGEFVSNKLTDAVTRLNELIPERELPNLFPITTETNANY